MGFGGWGWGEGVVPLSVRRRFFDFFFKAYRLDRAAGVGDTLTTVLTCGRES